MHLNGAMCIVWIYALKKYRFFFKKPLARVFGLALLSSVKTFHATMCNQIEKICEKCPLLYFLFDILLQQQYSSAVREKERENKMNEVKVAQYD